MDSKKWTEMSDSEIKKIQIQEWTPDPEDPEAVQAVCQDMMDMPVEEYREFLRKRDMHEERAPLHIVK